MNNEEAIGILKEEMHHTEFHLHDKNKVPEFYEEMGRYCEALKMAINALNGKDDITEKAKEGELVKAYTKGFDTAVEIAKTERPQGEWVDHSCYKDVIICSNCNIGGNRYYKDFKFCPNCGASMKGGAK